MKHALHTVFVVIAALAARAVVVAWAYDDIPPIADGSYYDILGRRLAEGHGYTWLWPDGAVTFAAHYPVGYPALVALAYLVLGPTPGAAMVMNALIGGVGAGYMHRAALRVTTPTAAALAALAGFALHPALVSYTPALMTEGVSATFVAAALSAALAMTDDARRKRFEATLTLGVVLGFASLVRPQLLAFAPAFALVACAFGPSVKPGKYRSVRRIAKPVAIVLAVTACALVVIGPWTARNCSRMGRCALVSMNGGWNLLIGTNEQARGTWAPAETPPACMEVFDEAMKDRCFAREGSRTIVERPGAWLSLAPKKLSATFDHVGAGPWYLHDANPIIFNERARTLAAVLEEIAQRVLYALALMAAVHSFVRGRGKGVRIAVLALAGFAGAAAPGWITVLVFSAAALASSVRREAPKATRLALGLAGVAVLGTALTHVAFFGAGRYALVVVPALVLAGGTLFFRAPVAVGKPFDRKPQS